MPEGISKGQRLYLKITDCGKEQLLFYVALAEDSDEYDTKTPYSPEHVSA